MHDQAARRPGLEFVSENIAKLLEQLRIDFWTRHQSVSAVVAVLLVTP
jgi:hypothetical protein